MSRVHIHITGIVQGVGMRPFVYREAVGRGIRGWVLNAGDGVHIEVAADEGALAAFVDALRTKAPAAARIDSVEVSPAAGDEAAGENRPGDSARCDGGGDARVDDATFTIRASDADTARTTLVSPDIATCPDCLHELFDPADRRYHYPFINCTNCGPRFTIIRSLPYDRAATSMDAFPMCPSCAAEYADPRDRRFHAQPDACFACGPHISWREHGDEEARWGDTRERSDAIIERCAELLASGGIVAIKGLGGFHLACNAADERAVAELRRRKRRPRKPLAIMVSSLEVAERLCRVDGCERDLLAGSVRPIVLLRQAMDDAARREAAAGAQTPPELDSTRSHAGHRHALAPSVAFDPPEVGVMLPYTPLQHLLLAACRVRGLDALVMTSGNISGEPIEVDDARAWANLVERGLADALLGNDRPILSRFDDSVARVVNGRAMLVRRARGYAPQPVALPPLGAQAPADADGDDENGAGAHGAIRATTVPTILACGAEQKATLAYTREAADGTALCILSQHIGDVERGGALDCWHEVRARMASLFGLAPHAIACDLHPRYLTGQWARAEAERTALPLVEVQHHHAHIAAGMAEAIARGGLAPGRPVIGLAFDGTGAGTDGTIWGGEAIVARLDGYARVAHLEPWPLPGGAAAVRDPRRCAFGLLVQTGQLGHPGATHLLGALTDAETTTMATMIDRGLNCPRTSSMGRLLDALAALTGICDQATYEGEPAIALEAAAWSATGDEAAAWSAAGDTPSGRAVHTPYRFGCRWQAAAPPDDATRARQARVGELPVSTFLPEDEQCAVDIAPLVAAVLDGLAARRDPAEIALDIHRAVVQLIVDLAETLREKAGISDVVLGGGVFMNRLILEGSISALSTSGFTVHLPSSVPVNDGSIAYGQAAVARARLARNDTRAS